MDSVRYYAALILVIILPPLLLFRLLIHPFVGFWRKVGPVWTYSVVGGVITLGMAGLFLVRNTLLSIDFGTNYPLMALGALFLVIPVWLRLLLHRAVLGWG